MIPQPTLLKPESVPSDLICSICHDVPVIDPVVVKGCEHLFCGACIEASWTQKPECPMDRRSLPNKEDIRQPPSGIVLRIWSQIPIACGHHENCSWRGELGNYTEHLQRSCRNNARQRADCTTDMKRVQELENEVTQLKDEKRELLVLLQRVRSKLEEVSSTQQQHVSTHEHDPSYSYDRSQVVKLSQLICAHLENKPDEIDANRIFNCVRNCIKDYEKGWGDNPEHFGLDMRMLIHVCLASTWFTDRQRIQIQECAKEMARRDVD